MRGYWGVWSVHVELLFGDGKLRKLKIKGGIFHIQRGEGKIEILSMMILTVDLFLKSYR